MVKRSVHFRLNVWRPLFSKGKEKGSKREEKKNTNERGTSRRWLCVNRRRGIRRSSDREWKMNGEEIAMRNGSCRIGSWRSFAKRTGKKEEKRDGWIVDRETGRNKRDRVKTDARNGAPFVLRSLFPSVSDTTATPCFSINQHFDFPRRDAAFELSPENGAVSNEWRRATE